MRELSTEEMLLVAGGNFMASSKEDDRWWDDAFDSLDAGLAAIATLFGGFVGSYIDSFREAIERARETGELTEERERAYNDYMYQATGDPAYAPPGGG